MAGRVSHATVLIKAHHLYLHEPATLATYFAFLGIRDTIQTIWHKRVSLKVLTPKYLRSDHNSTHGPKFSENNGPTDQFSRNFGPPDQNFRLTKISMTVLHIGQVNSFLTNVIMLSSSPHSWEESLITSQLMGRQTTSNFTAHPVAPFSYRQAQSAVSLGMTATNLSLSTTIFQWTGLRKPDGGYIFSQNEAWTDASSWVPSVNNKVVVWYVWRRHTHWVGATNRAFLGKTHSVRYYSTHFVR